MALKIILSLFVLCTIFCEYAVGQLGMGPLNMHLIKANKCPDDESVIDVGVLDVDGKPGFTVSFDLPFEFDNSLTYAISVDKEQNGQIQKGVFKHGGNNACKELEKLLGKFWTKITSAMGMGQGCPKAAGNFKVDKFPFDQNDLGLKTFLYGKFILTGELFKDKKKIACIIIEFTNDRA